MGPKLWYPTVMHPSCIAGALISNRPKPSSMKLGSGLSDSFSPKRSLSPKRPKSPSTPLVLLRSGYQASSLSIDKVPTPALPSTQPPMRAPSLSSSPPSFADEGSDSDSTSGGEGGGPIEDDGSSVDESYLDGEPFVPTTRQSRARKSAPALPVVREIDRASWLASQPRVHRTAK